ncbi:19095_t:CDS:1, partial [Gigaspora margarita]
MLHSYLEKEKGVSRTYLQARRYEQQNYSTRHKARKRETIIQKTNDESPTSIPLPEALHRRKERALVDRVYRQESKNKNNNIAILTQKPEENLL